MKTHAHSAVRMLVDLIVADRRCERTAVSRFVSFVGAVLPAALSGLSTSANAKPPVAPLRMGSSARGHAQRFMEILAEISCQTNSPLRRRPLSSACDVQE